MVPSAGHKVPIPWYVFPFSENRVPTPRLSLPSAPGTGPLCRTQDSLSGRSLPCAKHMVPSAGHRVPIPGRSFRVTQGVSSPGAASLLLGTGPLSRIQGLHPRASFPPAGHRVPLPGCSLPSAGQRSLPGVQGPLPGAQVPSARQTVHFPSATSTPMGTGPLPGVEGSLRGHSLLSEGRTLGSPRRSASHADAAPPGADKPSWAQPPPAA